MAAALPATAAPSLHVRRLAPDDGALVQAFVGGLSAHARRQRFHGALNELSPRQLDIIIGAADPRALSLVAFAAHAAHLPVVALAQYAVDESGTGEFAIVVGDAWQGLGIGRRLLRVLLAHAERRGIATIHGCIDPSNHRMRALAASAGFAPVHSPDPAHVRVQWRSRRSGRRATLQAVR